MVEVDSNDIRNDLVRINHAKEMSMLKMNAQSPGFFRLFCVWAFNEKVIPID